MKAVQGLFGGDQMKAIRQAQQRQQEELATQRRNTEAKETALMRLFSGGQGRSLASSTLATTLGG